MNDESQIVWKLPREQKGRYVAAARKEGCTLIEWLARACEARTGTAEGNDEGRAAKDLPGNRDDAGGMGEA